MNEKNKVAMSNEKIGCTGSCKLSGESCLLPMPDFKSMAEREIDEYQGELRKQIKLAKQSLDELQGAHAMLTGDYFKW